MDITSYPISDTGPGFRISDMVLEPISDMDRWLSDIWYLHSIGWLDIGHPVLQNSALISSIRHQSTSSASAIGPHYPSNIWHPGMPSDTSRMSNVIQWWAKHRSDRHDHAKKLLDDGFNQSTNVDQDRMNVIDHSYSHREGDAIKMSWLASNQRSDG